MNRRLVDRAIGNTCWSGPSGRSCYIFNTNQVVWQTARSTCLQDGGHLVTLETEGESDFILQILRSSSEYASYNWWNAANDIDNEGVWVWADINQPVTIDRWGSTLGGIEPNNEGGQEHCGELRSDFNFLLNDSQCTKKFMFICEYEWN
ncbi:hypothetical protein CAPTEDRAFT_227762 [Capitella teleta]|uniref:C-type lectin domain-containing protein n=1 Tax=Capitella teleta TaxID=283909 RepID=R7TKW4_CAPTE|nr:hypothetical protein CAPTEDRAFT_227762 [Capitella teleta]|eukprot:ELT94463.1 hypothetical protein CAPTEDRAFT_227762 [Capitella teleta]